MDLLELARIGVIEPIFTQEVVAEWERVAKEGRLDGIRYEDADLVAFCDLVAPLLSVETLAQVRLGRAQVPGIPIATAGRAQIITQHPKTGQATTETHVRDERTLVLKDPADAHLFQVALDLGCDYLCTSNTKDLPEGLVIGPVRCITPESLMTLLRKQLGSQL